jgi:hypothetical protein
MSKDRKTWIQIFTVNSPQVGRLLANSSIIVSKREWPPAPCGGRDKTKSLRKISRIKIYVLVWKCCGSGLYQIFLRIWKHPKILRIFDVYSYAKKLKEKKNFRSLSRYRIYVYEYFLELVECKFARNGLTKWKTF